MVRTSNPIIKNTSSVGGTSAVGISAETQHKESTETHVSRNKNLDDCCQYRGNQCYPSWLLVVPNVYIY